MNGRIDNTCNAGDNAVSLNCKIRYLIKFEKFIWEVDVFLKENKGLIVAEVELEYENQVFIKPKWVGKEISFDRKYYNCNLSKNPYSLW